MRYVIGAEIPQMRSSSMQRAITPQAAARINSVLRARQKAALGVFLPAVIGGGVGALFRKWGLGGLIGSAAGFGVQWVKASKTVEPTGNDGGTDQ